MKTHLQEWYNIYKIYRDKLNSIIRLSKTMHYKLYFQKFKDSSRKIWDGINEIISKRKSKQSPINIIDKGKFISDQSLVTNKFNLFFTSIGPNLSGNIADLGETYKSYLPIKTKSSFFFSPTNENEIECELILLSDSKSSDLPIKLIKLASKPLSKFLCIIINHSFQTGTFPNKLKFAIVTPIHKGNCHLTLGNYRQISLLPVFSKIIEKLMYVRLMKFLMKKNILFDHQYGFQKNKITSHAILDIYTKIVSSIENKDSLWNLP